MRFLKKEKKRKKNSCYKSFFFFFFPLLCLQLLVLFTHTNWSCIVIFSMLLLHNLWYENVGFFFFWLGKKNDKNGV